MSVVTCNLVLSRTLVRKRKDEAMAIANYQGMSARRRVRLSRTMFAFSMLLLLIAGLLGSQAAVATGESIRVGDAFHYVSVLPGDSLWQLAELHAPNRDPQDWIADVILLNNLSSAQLTIGDRLAIPNN